MCKKLSVIVPVYNGKEYIEKNIERLYSIKAMIEIIIVDDGSTDDSYDYCRSLFGQRSEVKIYRKTNGGIASARNYGLKYVTGDYVLFVDQDDEIDAESVSKALDYVMQNELDVCFWSTSFLNSDGITKPCDIVFRDTICDRSYIKSVLLPSLVMRKETDTISYIGHIWSCLIAFRIIEEKSLRFKKFVDYEDDLIFIFDVLMSVKTVGFIKSIGYYWRVNDQSYSHKEKKYDGFLIKIEDLYDYFFQGLCSIEVDDTILSGVDIYRHQKIVIEYIRNICKAPISCKELRCIIELTTQSDYKKAIHSECFVTEDTRFGFLLFLLRMRCEVLCVVFVRVYYILKSMKNRKQ